MNPVIQCNWHEKKKWQLHWPIKASYYCTTRKIDHNLPRFKSSDLQMNHQPPSYRQVKPLPLQYPQSHSMTWQQALACRQFANVNMSINMHTCSADINNLTPNLYPMWHHPYVHPLTKRQFGMSWLLLCTRWKLQCSDHLGDIGTKTTNKTCFTWSPPIYPQNQQLSTPTMTPHPPLLHMNKNWWRLNW